MRPPPHTHRPARRRGHTRMGPHQTVDERRPFMAKADDVIENLTHLPALPTRRADSHKGDFGRVLVVAGSRGMSGAAVLCASAALRAGAGLVRLAVPEGILPLVAPANPCYLT